MARRSNALVSLLAQVDRIAPNRSKKSDGWIGDAAHAARKSEHNPDKNGIVHAQDFTHDPVNMPGQKLADALVASRDPRIMYLIWNRRIWQGSWQPYHGLSPHTEHVHVSVYGDDGSPWNLPGFESAPVSNNGGLSQSLCKTVQSVLNKWYPALPALAVDGIWGPATEKRVRYMQENARITVDGIVGPVTLQLLGIR